MINRSKIELSVLITDDMPQNRAYFADILQNIIPHFDLYEAGDGKEAIDLVESFIKQQGKSLDLIIMDFKMPVLDGAQATASIRAMETQLCPTQPSIILTWSSSLHTPYQRADDWLPKMTNAKEVKAKLIEFGLLQGS